LDKTPPRIRHTILPTSPIFFIFAFTLASTPASTPVSIPISENIRRCSTKNHQNKLISAFFCHRAHKEHRRAEQSSYFPACENPARGKASHHLRTEPTPRIGFWRGRFRWLYLRLLLSQFRCMVEKKTCL